MRKKNSGKKEDKPKGRVRKAAKAADMTVVSSAEKRDKDTDALIYMWILDHAGENLSNNLDLRFE